MATLNEIDSLTKKYAERRAALAACVATLQDELRRVRNTHLPGIKRAVASARDTHYLLSCAIAESPECFEKRRTLTLHGVRVGFQKAKGRIEFDDPERVVQLVRKHFPEQFDVLVKVKETPVKDALAQLPASDLKRLGIEIADAGDVVFIKDAAGDVDKLVDALLEEDVEP